MPEPQTPEQDERTTDAPPEPTTDEVLEEDLLIEEVSIDGMCGVY